MAEVAEMAEKREIYATYAIYASTNYYTQVEKMKEEIFLSVQNDQK